MATVDQLAQLRRMADVASDDSTYTEEVLAAIIDSSTSLTVAAVQVWTEKAAAYAKLVDTSESGSSRSLSQLQKNAQDMRDYFAGVAEASTSTGRSFTVGVERA